MNGQPDFQPLKEITQQEQAEVDREFREFWLPIIQERNATPILGMNLEAIKRELTDWSHCIHEVSKVYCRVTGNRMSKPNYIAEEVIFEYERELERAIDEATADAIAPMTDEIQDLKDKVRRLQKQLRTRRANKRKK
ncbi:MAG: hypothetical protein ABL876_07950 [Chitinophagaceae bacterium]